LQLDAPSTPPILTPRSSWMLAIEAMERRTQIIEHDGETAVERSTAADYHIIAVRSHGYGVHALHQFAKPAADAISLGRGAVLFGHREADPDRAVIVAAAILDYECGGVHPQPVGNGEEVRPLPQPVHGDISGGSLRRSGACGRVRAARQELSDHRSSRGGHESRDGACAPVCWVDKSASRESPLTGKSPDIEVKSGNIDPNQAVFGPNEPPRSKPGHCGQLARLIRERPLFVNLAL
jgi:hypothetical protein